jgi:FtsH ternary system domain X1
MSLAAGTRAVLRWALAVPDAGDAAGEAEAGPMPLADAIDSGAIEALARPDEPLRALASRLAAAAVARLGLRAPPLDDDTAPGPYGIWLAAACAARNQPALAAELARLCPPPRGAWDLALRHAVVAPVLERAAGDAGGQRPGAVPGALPKALITALRTASPLTSLLDHPAPGEHDHCVKLATGVLLTHAHGRRVLAHALAAPIPGDARGPVIARWRAQLLDRLRVGTDEQRGFVLDVYEIALAQHRAATLAEIERGHAALAEPGSSAFERALALAEWWRPLWHLRRAWPESLRERVHLDVHGVLAGLRLHGRARALAAV